MKPGHTVTFTLDEYGITPTFLCYASPGDLFCRMFCPEGCMDPGECAESGHVLKDNGQCLFVEWMESIDPLEAYVGGATTTRAGLVTVDWTAEGEWAWRFPEPGDMYR